MFEGFPYTNFHELNLDWIVKIAKDFLDKYTSIQQIISDGETSLSNLTETGETAITDLTETSETALQTKATELQGLLDQWYNTHSADIAGQLAESLASLVSATNMQLASFNAQAEAKAIETIDSIPDDYTALSNKALLLQKYFSNGYIGSSDEFRIPAALYTVDGIIDQYGNISPISGWNTTDFIEIPTRYMYFSGNNFPAANYNTIAFYDETRTLISVIKGTNTLWIYDHPTVKYFRASKDTQGTYYTTIAFSRTVDIDDAFNKMYTSNDPITLDASYYIHPGILSSNAQTIDDTITDFETTDYLPVFSNEIIFGGNHFPATSYNTFALYDKDLTVLNVIHGNDNVLQVSDYPTAKFFRASRSTDNTYYTTICNKLETVFHVGSGQEFTTLRSGIARAIKIPNATVIVHPGTYDLTQEFATEISAASSSSNVGIVLQNGITVLFLPGAKVTALFPSSNNWINIHFSPFLSGYTGIVPDGFTLIGLNIEASNCRYCVHDEYSGANIKYHNTYKNCIMKMTYDSASGADTPIMQCIGGGLGKTGYIEIDNCKFTTISNVTGENPSVSYHNAATADAESLISISNCYVSTCFRFGYHGSSTKKTQVIVNNCSMGSAIIKRAEELSDIVDNIELSEWNNTIR